LLCCFVSQPLQTSQATHAIVTAPTRPPPMSLNSLHRLSAAGLSSTAFATTVWRLLVCAGSPGNPSDLSRAVGSAIATAPRFTMCPRAPLARHRVEAARGGEGALALSFRATRNTPKCGGPLQLLAKLQEVHQTLESLGEASGRSGRFELTTPCDCS
jgi:hypothetical protein